MTRLGYPERILFPATYQAAPKAMTTKTTRTSWDRIALALLIAGQLAYAALLVTYGRFIAHDEIAYKAAGREWGLHGRLVATEEEGVPYWSKEVHCRGIGLPLFPLAFGIWVRLFGFTLRTSVAFDVAISLLLSWVTYAVARTLNRSGPRWPGALAALFVLPLTLHGRPEGLAMILAFVGWILCVRSEKRSAWFIAGILEGLAGATSIAAAFFIGWLVLLRRNRPANVMLWLATAAVTFGSILAYASAVSVGDTLSSITTGAGQASGRSWSMILDGFRYGRTPTPAAIAMLIPIAVAGRRNRNLWLVPLIVQLAIPVLFPREFYYVWIVGPMLLAIDFTLYERTNHRGLLAALGLPVYLLAISRVLISWTVMATLPEDQRLEANLRLVESIIPRTSTVMVYDYWPALGAKYHVFASDAYPGWDRIDYLVLTGNGSGAPGERQHLFYNQEPHVINEYRVVLDRLNRKPFSIGPFHTHSAWGFGPLILQRIRRPGESNESANLPSSCW